MVGFLCYLFVILIELLDRLGRVIILFRCYGFMEMCNSFTLLDVL